MPVLPQYEPQYTPEGALPHEVSSANQFESSGPGALGLGNVMSETSSIVAKQQAEQDVLTQQANVAQMDAQWTAELHRRALAAPPGDMGFVDQVTQDYQDYVAQNRGQAQTAEGQQAYDLGTAKIGASLSERAQVFQADSAGKKAEIDMTQRLQSNQATVYNDPTSFQRTVQQFEADINDPNGPYAKMPAEARYKWALQGREAIALSAVQGEMMPPGAAPLVKAELASGKWDDYINGEKRHMLDSEIVQREKADRYEAFMVSSLASAAKKEADQATMNSLIAGMNTGKDGKGQLQINMQDIINADLPPAQKEVAINMYRQRAKDIETDADARVNPVEKRSLMMQYVYNTSPDFVFNPMQAKQAFQQAYGQGKLSYAEVTGMSAEVDRQKDESGRTLDQQFNNAREVAHKYFTRGGFMPQPNDELDADKFSKYMDGERATAMQNGKNPMNLITPGKSEFLLTPQNMERFRSKFTPGAPAQQADAQQPQIVGPSGQILVLSADRKSWVPKQP